MKNLLNRLSEKGNRIGIAAGTFGLIHAGTVAFLREARSRCDCLFAAILTETDSDAGRESALPSSRDTAELLRPEERRRILAAMQEIEAAGFVGGRELPLAEWTQAAPAACWMFSGSEADVPEETARELRRMGIAPLEIEGKAHAGTTTRTLLRRMSGD